MCRHGGLWVEVVYSALNVKPFYGVGVIRGPDLRRVAKHTEVKSVASRGAAFKENIRVPFMKYLVKNLIKTQNVSVEELALLL